MELEFFVGPGKKVSAHLGLSLESVQWPKLRNDNVPQDLWELIQYAEFFGISDDILRYRLALVVPLSRLQELKRLVTKYDNELDEWLAGPEARSENFSSEYIAFSAMRMVSDDLEMIMRRRLKP